MESTPALLLLERPAALRLLPALALSGSGLAELHRQGRWTPMRQSQCLRLLVDLIDLYEEAGLPVLRVGQQPAADSQSRLVAGPYHPNLRGLVDGLRLRRRYT